MHTLRRKKHTQTHTHIHLQLRGGPDRDTSLWSHLHLVCLSVCVSVCVSVSVCVCVEVEVQLGAGALQYIYKGNKAPRDKSCLKTQVPAALPYPTPSLTKTSVLSRAVTKSKPAYFGKGWVSDFTCLFHQENRKIYLKVSCSCMTPFTNTTGDACTCTPEPFFSGRFSGKQARLLCTNAKCYYSNTWHWLVFSLWFNWLVFSLWFNCTLLWQVF